MEDFNSLSARLNHIVDMSGQTVTDTYIDFDWKKVDDAVRKVINYINDG